MSERDLRALREWNVSVGLMLETASDRLAGPGGPHEHAPDKRPARRLRTIEAAGRAGIAFTTGILFGIGETRAERVEALLAIRELHERHGHVQEVIVQNFRAKPRDPDGAAARALAGRAAPDSRGRAPPARAGHERAGPAQSLAGNLPRADRLGAERLGRRLARSRSTTSTPRRPGPTSPRSRRRRRRPAPASGSAWPSTPSTFTARGSSPGPCGTACSPGRRGGARPRPGGPRGHLTRRGRHDRRARGHDGRLPGSLLDGPRPARAPGPRPGARRRRGHRGRWAGARRDDRARSQRPDAGRRRAARPAGRRRR